MPLSVSGWWTICCRILNGSVAMWAPASAACVIWSGFRIEAARTSVSSSWIATISDSSRITIMPSWLMSSRRPTNGDSSDAPALAARSPWLAVKMSVQFVLIPSSANRDIASRPSSLIGTFTTMFGASLANARPSVSIPSTSSATTSAETGPGVIEQISLRTSSYDLPEVFANRVGFVVTPSRTPHLATWRISLMSAVSRKIFIGRSCRSFVRKVYARSVRGPVRRSGGRDNGATIEQVARRGQHDPDDDHGEHHEEERVRRPRVEPDQRGADQDPDQHGRRVQDLEPVADH